MSRELFGHTGPHASSVDKPVAPSMLRDTTGKGRKMIKRNHNRKARQWMQRILNGKVEQ
jgi:hypothetical protein